MRHSLEVQKEYETFLQAVINNEELYVLQGEDGLACQSAMADENTMCVLIWGCALTAEDQCSEDVDNLRVDTVALYDFLFRWLPNMDGDGVICSINWHEEEGGLEVGPAALKEHLMSVLPEDIQQRYRQRLETEEA